jgi:uncharacterized protein (TIGR00299 family) protein
MAILFCDCFSGISGDMFLGALLDAGMPVEYISEQFRRLNLHEFHGVTAERVLKGALAATRLNLEIHDHSAEHPHDHDHDDHHDHHDHHRHLGDIRNLIEASSLSDRVKQTSLRIFQKLAEAEAKVHGSSIDEVHFHEVGAVDSILDIVGAAIGLEYFQIDALYASPLPLGTGQVVTQHGLLPLPAPATMELIRMAQAPVTASKATVELVTPTGAAILAALAQFSQPEVKVERVGIGAGQRDLEWPNVLRIMIGAAGQAGASYLEIETNIDDMNPQVYGYLMAKLFQAGALDVFFTPLFMKKNRPATKLSVIASKENESELCALILRETSTMGLRIKPVNMLEAQWKMQNIETRFGTVPVKIKYVQGEFIQAKPEFDVCVRLSEENKVPLMQILQETESLAMAACKEGGVI